MKAILIKPTEHSIEAIEITNKQDIIKLIGFDTVIADDIGIDGDHLYFDEECFLRGTQGRFQLDKLIPVSGVGVIAGIGENGALTNCQSDIDDIRSRIKFTD
jgi:hypothetical protein